VALDVEAHYAVAFGQEAVSPAAQAAEEIYAEGFHVEHA
jgi:hypothetical protein